MQQKTWALVTTYPKSCSFRDRLVGTAVVFTAFGYLGISSQQPNKTSCIICILKDLFQHPRCGVKYLWLSSIFVQQCALRSPCSVQDAIVRRRCPEKSDPRRDKSPGGRAIPSGSARAASWFGVQFDKDDMAEMVGIHSSSQVVGPTQEHLHTSIHLSLSLSLSLSLLVYMTPEALIIHLLRELRSQTGEKVGLQRGSL